MSRMHHENSVQGLRRLGDIANISFGADVRVTLRSRDVRPVNWSLAAPSARILQPPSLLPVKLEALEPRQLAESQSQLL